MSELIFEDLFDEFSDNTNFYIIIVLFLLFYVYLKFVFIKIQTKMNWSEIQCNPAYMLIGSLIDSFIITDSNKSIVNFDKCVQKIAERQLYKDHEKDMNENKEKIKNDLTTINDNLNQNLDDVDLRQDQLLNIINDTNLNFEDIVKKQNKINETIIDASGNISSLVKNIGDLSNKFKNTVQNFTDSDLMP